MKNAILSVAVFATLSLVSLSAKAAEEPHWIHTCRQSAQGLFEYEAKESGAELKEGSLQVCGIDQHWWNPSRYVWFCAEMVKPDGSTDKLQKLFQYYHHKC